MTDTIQEAEATVKADAQAVEAKAAPLIERLKAYLEQLPEEIRAEAHKLADEIKSHL